MAINQLIEEVVSTNPTTQEGIRARARLTSLTEEGGIDFQNFLVQVLTSQKLDK
jgi:hypothetical protein